MISYYKNGQLYYKGEFLKNHQHHGLWESYCSDGKTLRKGEYKNGKQRGLWYRERYTK